MPKERKYKRDYAGTEASPYREFLDRKGDYNQEHEAAEPPEANPDMLDETKHMYYMDPEAIRDSDEYVQVLKALPTLTSKQREVLRLVGHEGRSFEEASNILGVSKGTIQKTVERIRKKIKGE